MGHLYHIAHSFPTKAQGTSWRREDRGTGNKAEEGGRTEQSRDSLNEKDNQSITETSKRQCTLKSCQGVGETNGEKSSCLVLFRNCCKTLTPQCLFYYKWGIKSSKIITYFIYCNLKFKQFHSFVKKKREQVQQSLESAGFCFSIINLSIYSMP